MTYEELLEENKKLRNQLEAYARVRVALLAAKPEHSGHYFLCGESGPTKNGLPDYVDICPSYGSDSFVRYKKTNLEGGLEW